MKFRKPKPDYEHIAQLEHELDLDGSATVERVDRVLEDERAKRVSHRDSKRYGPVLLEKRIAPLEALSMAPGAKWIVPDPRAISYFPVSNSYMASAYSVVEPPKPKVHLPAGVNPN